MSIPFRKRSVRHAQVCNDQTVTHQQPVKDEKRIAGTVIGAVVGGVLGSQVGDGTARKLRRPQVPRQVAMRATRFRSACNRAIPIRPLKHNARRCTTA